MAVDVRLRLLRAVQRLGHAFCRIERAAAASADVTVAQLRILQELSSRGEGGVTVGELAAGQGVAFSTMTRNLLVLERLGWVARSAGERDRRTVHVSLTSEGRQRAEAVLRASERMISEALSGFHPSDRIERAVALERVAAALEVVEGGQ